MKTINKNIYICKICGKKFEKWPSQYGAGTCSQKCGKKIRDYSKSNSGQFKNGDKSFWKGKKLYPETKIKLSIAQRKRFSNPQNHPRWKGGISTIINKIRHSIEYRLWREAVFARDNWICQKCFKRGIFLHAHHIKSFAKYPELRFAIDNGITYCKRCHYKTLQSKRKLGKKMKAYLRKYEQLTKGK